MPCATRLTNMILLALFLSVGLTRYVSAESLDGGNTAPADRRSRTVKNGLPLKTVEQTGGVRL
jgi:hypothetical protein